jgi:ubiquinone/menaquinone biosynthesis C-methylase UbiE
MPIVTETAALFDDWARAGRAEGMEQGHRPRALQALEDMPIKLGDKLLDLGCGNGWATKWLKERAGNFGAAVGVDGSPAMVARAKELHTRYGLSFRHSSFESLIWKDRFFHHVFSMEALYYAADLGVALEEAARVLAEGGTLTVCTDFYEENPHCHGWPELMGVPMTLLSEAEWAAALEDAGLVVERSWRCLDARPAPEDKSAEEQAEIDDFRQNIGSLAVRARKPL